MLKYLHLPLVFGLLFVVGCGQNDSLKEKKQSADADARMAAEQQLLSDPDKAIPELIQRLRASVKLGDGFLMIEDESLSLYRLASPLAETNVTSFPFLSLSVLSLNSPWVIKCGAEGITVVFGNSISGSGESDEGSNDVEVGNDVIVWLTAGSIPKKRCQKIAPALGKEIQTILTGG